MDELLRLAVGLALVAIGASVMGGYLVLAVQASVLKATGVQPADAFNDDDQDGAPTRMTTGAFLDADDWNDGPEYRAVGEDTLRLVIPGLAPVPCCDGRHQPGNVVPVDDTVRLPSYLLRPDLYPTDEYPQLAPRPRERAV